MLWTLKRCLKGYMELDSLKYVKDEEEEYIQIDYVEEILNDKVVK